MGRPIFLSYRRDDTEGEAGRLYDDLARTFGEHCIFMDVVGISPGVDFRKVIDENVSQCGVLLALIGPTWATISGDDGKRRLENPNDFVRLEIATALKRDIAVIPVLVHGAHMPHQEQLPDALQDLAFRNSVEITHARWNSDVQLLMNALQAYVAAPQQGRNRPVHAEVPVQLPPPYPRGPQSMPTTKSRRPLYAVAGIVLALLIGAGVFFGLRHAHAPKPATTPAPTPLVAPAAATNGTATAGTGGTQPGQPVANSGGNQPASSAPATHENAGGAIAAAVAGTWVNGTIDPGSPISRLTFTSTPDALLAFGYGSCIAPRCAFHEQKATIHGDTITASLALGTGDQHAIQTTIVPSGDHLNVTGSQSLSDGSTKPFHLTFFRPGNVPAPTPVNPSATPAATNAFVGIWTRPSTTGNAPIKIQIYQSNGQLLAHAWGDCNQSPCDWGVQPLQHQPMEATATWQFRPTEAKAPLQVATVVLKVVPSGIFVQTENSFPGTNLHGKWNWYFTRAGD